MLNVLKVEPKSAQAVMDYDYDLLNAFQSRDPPLLYFHAWAFPSITYGYFTKVSEHMDLEKAKDFDFGRRPTGGGIIFHTHDLSFTLIVPINHPLVSTNTLKTYEAINGVILKAIGEKASLIPPQESFSSSPFCMAGPTVYDIVINNKKAGGAAQRRTKRALLHHGSLHLKPLCDCENFFKNKKYFHCIKENSYTLALSREVLQERIIAEFKNSPLTQNDRHLD